MVKELQLVSAPVDEGSAIFAFLRGFGPKYITLTVDITTNLEQLTLDDIVASLKTHNAMQSFYQQASIEAEPSNNFPLVTNLVTSQSNL